MKAKTKKLVVREEVRLKLERMQKILAGTPTGTYTVTAETGCGEQCRVTCAHYCRSQCELGCTTNCEATKDMYYTIMCAGLALILI